MGDIRGGNCSMNNHILSQRYCGSNNGDVISGNGFINSHTLSQCNDSISLNGMDGDIENGDVSDVHGSIDIHTLYQRNGLKPLINPNNIDDI